MYKYTPRHILHQNLTATSIFLTNFLLIPCCLRPLWVIYIGSTQGPVLLLRSDAVASLWTNGSVALKWKLHCHWPVGLRRHQIAIVIQGSGHELFHSLGQRVNKHAGSYPMSNMTSRYEQWNVRAMAVTVSFEGSHYPLLSRSVLTE